jgi:thioredoxin-like negative regulator of GroEL
MADGAQMADGGWRMAGHRPRFFFAICHLPSAIRILPSAICFIAIVFVLASCTTTTPPPPAVTPQGDDRYLIDPRTGSAAGDPQTERKFDAAWANILSGNETEARRLLDEIRRKNPAYVPAALAQAVIDIHANRFDEALTIAKKHDTLAARVYEAEIAFRENDARNALTLYRAVAAQPGAPATAAERVAQLENTMYEQLLASAKSASEAESIALLREALTYRPAAFEPRVLLARKLLAQRSLDEAKRELDPLLNSAEVDRPEVQELLAEIDVGRGRFQEAIVRYDRLARRTKEPRYQQRLDEIKADWSSANMPAHYRAALDSPAITRADLAILLYWSVPSIRFARNLGAPPIAVDIEDVAGRDEIVRAIAIGVFDVDPVTRRVGPTRTVTAERLSRHLARVLQLRGAACARGMTIDKVLPACGVNDPLATMPPDALVSGRDAKALLDQVAKQL